MPVSSNNPYETILTFPVTAVLHIYIRYINTSYSTSTQVFIFIIIEDTDLSKWTAAPKAIVLPTHLPEELKKSYQV